MSFFSLGHSDSSHSQQVVVFLGIDSSGVSGALALCKKGDDPRILYTCRKSMSFQKEADPAKMLSLMHASLDHVLALIHKEGLPHLKFTSQGGRTVQTVHYTLASPWYVSQTHAITIKKPKPTLVTKELLNEMVADEKDAFVKKVAEDQYGGDLEQKLELVESKILNVRLNGYETAKPQGKRATEIEMTLYSSVADSSLADRLREATRKHFASAQAIFHTFPIVTFSALRDLPGTPSHFVHIDINAEVTDMTIVKNGVASQTITVPKGRNHFIRAIAREHRTSVESATSLCSLFMTGNLAPDTKRELQPIIENCARQWQQSVSESFVLLSETSFIPGSVYLTVAEGYGQFFRTLIADKGLNRGNSDGSPFSVTLLDCDFLAKHCKINACANEDTSLMLQSLFINRIHS